MSLLIETHCVGNTTLEGRTVVVNRREIMLDSYGLALYNKPNMGWKINYSCLMLHRCIKGKYILFHRDLLGLTGLARVHVEFKNNNCYDLRLSNLWADNRIEELGNSNARLMRRLGYFCKIVC